MAMQKSEAQTDFPQLLEKFRNKSEEHRDAGFSILASTRGWDELKTLLDDGESGFNVVGKGERCPVHHDARRGPRPAGDRPRRPRAERGRGAGPHADHGHRDQPM